MRKSRIRRALSLVLLLVLLLGSTACGSKQVPERVPNTEQSDAVTVVEVDRALLEQTAQWMMDMVPQAQYGSVGGEWLILGLARSGLDVPQSYLENYGEAVATYTAQQGGVLHEKKYTEYSRVILAWTAMGRQATDVGGYDLLLPLADYDQTVFQGINGPVFALLALDSGGYEIPENPGHGIQATRERYLDYILSAQTSDGGWTLAGDTGDTDLTAMALQALAKYQGRPDVDEAVEKGLALLSQLQQETGGFSAYGTESCESLSQVILALTELGVDVEQEAFVKNGTTLVDRLLAFRTSEGAFRHTLDGEADLMATEQAFYAMVALDRQAQGESSLYTMTQ